MIDHQGVWTLASVGVIGANAVVTVQRAGMAMSLDNDGDTIQLINGSGLIVDEFTFGAASPGERVSRAEL